MSQIKASLPEMISPYMKRLIEQTGGPNGPIGKQFIPNPKLENTDSSNEKDPQQEVLYESAPGLIYKYKGKLNENKEPVYYGRALWTISRYCATYCRFCFRGRMVGLPANIQGPTDETLSQKPYLSDEDIVEVQKFIVSHPEIKEIILSGGDPLITPKKYLQKIVLMLTELQQQGTVDIIRFHTRAPITNPDSLKDWHYDIFKSITNPYLVLHINHPAEITPEVLEVTDKLRKECHAILLSQSVLLKGVNDNQQTLIELFNKLIKHGIRPYYLHQNDPVYWAQHFTVPFDKALQLWQSLRPKLSGLAASAKFVIDTPHGVGKIAVPESPWNLEINEFKDFTKKSHKVIA